MKNGIDSYQPVSTATLSGYISLETKANADDLAHLEKNLAELAKALLSREQAKQELVLRTEFLKVERSIFSSNLERGNILLKYRDFYAPIGKLSAFLKAIGVDRRRAYRYIAKAVGVLSGSTKKASSKQSPLQKHLDSSLVGTVKDIVAYAKKAIKGLEEKDQKDVLRAVLETLTDYRRSISTFGKMEPATVNVVDKVAA